MSTLTSPSDFTLCTTEAQMRALPKAGDEWPRLLRSSLTDSPPWGLMLYALRREPRKP